MAVAITLCAEITRADMSVTVDGIIINKRLGKKRSKQGGKVAFNFTIKDIVCDTVNVVLWDKPEELLKINLTLRLGHAFRFSSLRSALSARSQEMNPRTTCPFILKMARWAVEKLPQKTEEKLMEIFNTPPLNVDFTLIPALLSTSATWQVNLMAAVVFKGEPRRVVLQNGESAVALDMEVTDGSLQTIIVTLWGAELTAFISEQIIEWVSVICLQDAVLKYSASRSNYVTMNAKTLVIPNSTGKAAVMIQRAVERARANGFRPRKINEIPKISPKYSSDVSPQWTTLRVIGDFFGRGTWGGDSDPYKPMVSILLFSNVISITHRIICPKCDNVVRASEPPTAMGQMAQNDSVCATCEFNLSSDCRQASVRASFADSNGGLMFQLNNTDLDCLLGGFSRGAIEEDTLREMLQKQLFRRFVLVFQILDFNVENRTLDLKTIKIRRPTNDDWLAYYEVAA